VPRLWNCTTGEVLAERVSRATTPWGRAIGYLLRRDIDLSEGLWLDRCSIIHTVGMRASIDVVFVDNAQHVVRIVSRARQNRFFYGGTRAVAALELGSGFVRNHRIALGDRVRLE
jgi:uncharacterized membrane protein (UPF0127 family)